MNTDDVFNQKYEVANMVIPKFLLAENPIVPNIDLTYIYSPHYMSLIMIIEENSEIVRLNDIYRAMPQQLFVYDELEQFRFVVIQNNVISTGGIYAPIISVEQFIEEAWQWYKAYLDWELTQMQGL
jgi:hypothetical protein|nr:MAG TPA: hypothetical protein [Caudoviricetes sp.]DAP16472.1 MAG TPA: hypothetical protein [Caudoviricetes sp.]DAP94156.1 MAG TPA: hypothetical protein [Caudoviricetes sp.]DAT14166.1 MAG TPA: hypothetical protein [Caudoviricetes sp.]